MASCIATDYISIVEFGNIEFKDESIDDVKSEIICQLNHRITKSEETEIAFRSVDSKTVFQYLFGMAVMGGAYERGEFHATSRIKALKVVSGLMQKEYTKISKENLTKSLDNYQWNEFTCKNEWFINEWLDLGLIGINYKENKYAIIAITDTD